MNPKPKLTLNQIKRSPKLGRQARASDFLTEDDRRKLQQTNARGKRIKRRFDDVDAYIAEMIARFGYEAYLAWNRGEIAQEKMNKMILAERARERAAWIPVEGIIISMVGSCIKRSKKEKAPKGPKRAQEIVKNEVKMAKGEM